MSEEEFWKEFMQRRIEFVKKYQEIEERVNTVKVIFLDIDGVLNCQSSKSKCGAFIGIDDSKVKLLKEIVDATGARIVLCSSWRVYWEKFDKTEQHEMGNYLDRKLKRCGLFILDKTIDKGSNRGYGIKQWLLNKPNVESWVVLDDDIFDDYESEGIMPHLVKTVFYDDLGGLQRCNVDSAIKMLNGEE